MSKTAVRNHMNEEVQSRCAHKVSGKIFITEEGETLIKSAFAVSKPQTKFAVVSANQFPQVSGEVSTLIAMLQKELDGKNQQIAALQDALKNTTQALQEAQATANAAQALHAGTIQKELAAAPSSGAEPGEPEEKPGFFGRLFSRKKG